MTMPYIGTAQTPALDMGGGLNSFLGGLMKTRGARQKQALEEAKLALESQQIQGTLANAQAQRESLEQYRQQQLAGQAAGREETAKYHGGLMEMYGKREERQKTQADRRITQTNEGLDIRRDLLNRGTEGQRKAASNSMIQKRANTSLGDIEIKSPSSADEASKFLAILESAKDMSIPIVGRAGESILRNLGMSKLSRAAQSYVLNAFHYGAAEGFGRGGATLTATELAAALRGYMKAPGEDPRVTAERRGFREFRAGTLKGEAGPAYDYVRQYGGLGMDDEEEPEEDDDEFEFDERGRP